MAAEKRYSWLMIVLAVSVIALAAGLRLAYVRADPPHGLSSSRAEYTDEGLKFYQARNRALFGRWWLETPWAMQGHLRNSPVPTVLGWAIFKSFGAGRVQARCISIASGILSCGILMLIGFRSRQFETGLLAALFAALNCVSVSYDRIALFESLFIFLLLCAALFFLERGRLRWILAPAFLALAYLTRPSAVVMAAAFALTLVTEWWRASSRPWRRKALSISAACAALALVALAVWRFAPDNQIVAQVKARFTRPYFEIFPPLAAAADLFVRTFADSRLAVSMPILTVIALVALPAAALRPSRERSFAPRLLFTWWFVAVFFLVAFLDYRPTRYYALFLPAICWLAAAWLIDLARAPSEAPSGQARSACWLVAGFLVGIQLAGVALRCVLAGRHELPLLIDVDAVGLKSLQDFVESNFIGTGAVLQPPNASAAAALAAAMYRHVLNLALLGAVFLALAVLWRLVRARLFPLGLPPRLRVVLVVSLVFAVIVGQVEFLRDFLSRRSRRLEVQYAEMSVREIVGDNPRACIAGNWAPSLCMGTPYFTMPFAKDNGNAWDTFRRFPVTHFILELDSPNEAGFLAVAYPSQFARCRLLRTFNIDFYRIGLFEYSPPEGTPVPPWPFEKGQQ